jgi:hypothetical protein
MALNNIQLNSSLLTELYRNSLVQADATRSGKEEPIVTPITSDKIDVKVGNIGNNGWKNLGENKKNILLVVDYKKATYLPDKQLSFLVAILGACKLSLADVAILNVATCPDGSYDKVFDHFKSRTMVLFGKTPSEFAMPVDFPEFQVQVFNNCTFLHTPTLENLESDKILKSKLWVCLKRLFDL